MSRYPIKKIVWNMEVAEGFSLFFSEFTNSFLQLSSCIKFDHSFTFLEECLLMCSPFFVLDNTLSNAYLCEEEAGHQFGKGIEYYPGNFHEPTFPLKVTLKIELWLE